MPKKQRKFADDGWAVWVDGEDTSTVYLNNWLNPMGKSYVDAAIHIRGAKVSRKLSLYVPFSLKKDEVEDVSLHFAERKIAQAILNAACIMDYMKNAHTSEVAYNGKTMDVVHISTLDDNVFSVRPLSEGALIVVDIEKLHPFLDNDEIYFIFRMPHKSLDEIFRPQMNVGNVLGRLRDLVTTPVISEKYGYSIRINEARLLPEEITKVGAFHRQKLKKAAITLSINESYELNDGGCYRIRRLEENLYKDFLPKGYPCEDAITYQWNQNRESNLQGHFNFYYSITKDHVSKGSMLVYMLLLLAVGVLGDFVSEWVHALIDWIR